MKKIIYLPILFFSSCNFFTNQPSCNDEETKKIALELLKNSIENKITEESFSNHAYDTTAEAAAESGKKIEKAMRKKISELNLKSLKLENIITTSKIDSLKRCNCEAHIQHDVIGDIDFYYYVQFTDDGKLYVNVLDKKSE